MADLSFQPVADKVRVPQVTSLGDMIGMARNAQAYQQAAQTNPLALRQQQAETDVAEQTAKPRIQSAEELAKQSYIETIKKQYGLDTEQSNNFGKILGGFAYDKRLTTEELAKNPSYALDIMHEITDAARKSGIDDKRVSVLTSTGINTAINNPQAFPQYLANMYAQGMSAAEKRTSLQPTTAVDANGRTITTTPNLGANAPTVKVGQAGGFQSNAPANINAGAEVAPGMRVPYPIRRADTPYVAEPTEISDQNSGVEYRNRIVSAQSTLSENRRNVEEVIKQANLIGANLTEMEKGGGLIGKAGQKIRMAINSAEYEILAKDLARLALSNANAMGGAGNTVSGLDMQQVANGTIKMPPEKLIEIARRVQADQTNLDLQARGAQQFAQKYGDNNMKAYQQSWNANADSKIFEGINIINNEPNPKKINEQLTKLFPTEAKRATFLKKYRNIKSLSATGLQAEPLTKEDF